MWFIGVVQHLVRLCAICEQMESINPPSLLNVRSLNAVLQREIAGCERILPTERREHWQVTERR